jgi:hypothetical protein
MATDPANPVHLYPPLTPLLPSELSVWPYCLYLVPSPLGAVALQGRSLACFFVSILVPGRHQALWHMVNGVRLLHLSNLSFDTREQWHLPQRVADLTQPDWCGPNNQKSGAKCQETWSGSRPTCPVMHWMRQHSRPTICGGLAPELQIPKHAGAQVLAQNPLGCPSSDFYLGIIIPGAMSVLSPQCYTVSLKK